MKASLMLSLTLLLMASATVTAVAQPPSGGNAAQSITEEADNRLRLSFIRSVQVVPRASFVDISYSTPQPAGAVIEISTQRPLAAVVDLPDVIPAGQKAPPSFPPDVALTTFAISSDKVTKRTGHLRDLQPNTTYYYVITTVAPDGRTHRYWDKFTTINRVVKVVFERVLIVNKAFVGGNTWSFNFATDDSWLSDPDGWLLAYPGGNNSVPLGSSEWADVNVETTIQPASESLPLSVFAFAKVPIGDYRIERSRNDPRPEGHNTGSTNSTAWATARDGIDLTANSTDQPGTFPFKLAATGSGSLMMFEVLGRVEISYPSGARGGPVNIGTTSSPLTAAPAPIAAVGRVRVGSNDFNADGSGDILWHNASTGESQVWFMSGSSRVGRATILDGGRPTRIGPPWRIVGSRDFNGDGKTDLLWHNSSTGEAQIWYLNGSTFSGRATVLGETGGPARVGAPWRIVGTSDMNGDRKPDIVWHNGSTGETQIWNMDGHRVISRATVLDENGRPIKVGLPWSIVGTGDFNGDRKPDIVWHNASTRATQVWNMDGHRVTGRATVLDENGSPINVGLPWRITGTNDFNRDGSADILWHNGSTGGTQIWIMKGHGIMGRLTVDADRDGGGALVGSPWSIMSH